jgi:hypothetical protein
MAGPDISYDWSGVMFPSLGWNLETTDNSPSDSIIGIGFSRILRDPSAQPSKLTFSRPGSPTSVFKSPEVLLVSGEQVGLY